MHRSIPFFVPGEPKPQARPRTYKNRTFSEKSPWRKKVQSYAYEQLLRLHNYTIMGAIRVDILYYFQRPKIHFRTGKFSHIMKDDALKYCTNRYDLDNLNKAILDAITDADLIDDDRYVVQLNSGKIWVKPPFEQGASINIRELEYGQKESAV